MLVLHNKSPWALHQIRTFLLVALSGLLLPLSALVVLVALTLQKTGLVHAHRRAPVSHGQQTPRVLVTGVGMSKGLFLARTMHVGGWEVFGADFDKPGNLHCGRFSNALRKFFALVNPMAKGGTSEAYIAQVLEVITSEKIDLWISCSGVATAIEDARLAKAIESTKCKVFQLDEQVIETLDDKLKFMKKTSKLGLASLQWFALESSKDIPGAIHATKEQGKSGRNVKFMVKSASMDDASRGSLPLLDSQHLKETERILTSLDYSNRRQWILQEFIGSGEEYCTHAVVINGNIRAFTACQSDSVLMHYRQMDTQSILYANMLEFTQDYATGLGNITGHLSFDFLVRYRASDNGFTASLAPIECNPRCHTATVLFEGLEKELANVYLEVLQGVRNTDILQPRRGTETAFYWMAHDLVIAVSSLFDLFVARNSATRASALQQALDCVYHGLVWRDPTFLWWDPMPWFALNHLYWPWELIVSSWNSVGWKQLNVSTTKMFEM